MAEKSTKESALAHLAAESEKALKFAGMAGYNPYKFTTMKADPAKFLVEKEPTEAHINAALAVKFVEQDIIVVPGNVAPVVTKT